MEFVKDAVPWGSAIGLRINTLGTAQNRRHRRVVQDSAAINSCRTTATTTFASPPNCGRSTTTITLALMTVDHPAGTEIFVDERFVDSAAEAGFTTVATPHKIARAIDDNGQDVTDIVDTLDGKALDTFGRGQYQGITRDHYRRSRSRR